MYLNTFLRKSEGSTLLPFLLRFLLSDQLSDSEELWPWSGGDLLRQGVTQALEQSFPGPETSSCFFGRQNSLGNMNQGQNRPHSYMDFLIQRVSNCDSLVRFCYLHLLWLDVIKSEVENYCIHFLLGPIRLL